MQPPISKSALRTHKPSAVEQNVVAFIVGITECGGDSVPVVVGNKRDIAINSVTAA